MKFKIIIFSLLIILLVNNVFALKGVGIKWTSESAYVDEKSSVCLDYGIYNPWDEDTNAQLGVSKELQDVIRVKESETVFVKANTPSTGAVPVKLCFDIPKTYKGACLFAGLLCKQTCSLGEVNYKGEVVATGSGTEVGAGSGSTATVSASAPLEIRIKCDKHERSYVELYVGILIIILIIIGIVFFTRRKKYVNV